MQSEFEGINKLRKGTLLLILVPLLIGFIALILGASLFSIATPGAVSAALGAVGALVAVIVIGAILGIIGLLNIRGGFRILNSLGRDVGIGYTGTTLYLVSLILILIGAILTIVLVGVFIVYLGEVLLIIADILIGVGFYKVGEIYNESTTKIGGILAAIPIGIVSFIGLILVYVGLGKIRPMGTVIPPAQLGYPPSNINPMGAPMPQTQPNYPSQIYQVGQGIIRGNGYAQVSLYSSTQATVLSARIEGTGLSSVNVNPVVLQPGQNEVTIWFSNVSLLTPGSNYIVTLVVSIGGNMSEVKATAVYQP